MDQLFIELNNYGISMSLDKEDLVINFEGDEISESLINKIKENKKEIVSYLKKYNSEDNFEEIQPVEEQENYPISFAQKRLWISSQYAEASLAYMMPKIIDLSGELDLEIFEKAVNAVIERHESLRTIFKEEENGEVRQWILQREDLGFKILNLDFSKEQNSQELFNEFVQKDSYELFDLSKGPLIRATLVKISDEKYCFYYVMHHIISDGWSMGVLAEDIISFYEAFLRKETPSISKLEIQYKDYTAWQIDQLKNNKYQSDKDYWFAQLKEAVPTIDLPTNKVRPRVKSHNGEILEAHLSKELTTKIKRFSQEQEGSLFITLLSIWNVLLYRYTQQEEIIVGSSVAGRDHSALENQIGFFVNTLALKNKINPDDSFKEVYEKIKNNTLEAITHQNYPFDLLVEDLQIERDNSRNILFDIVLVGQNAADRAEDNNLGNEQVNYIKSKGKSNVKFDLEIGFFENGDSLLFNIYYNTDVYDLKTIESLIEHFRILSDQLLDSKEAVGSIDYLSQEDHNTLLSAFNDTVTEYSKEKTILDLFGEQAYKNPDAKALTYKEVTYSYRELDELSNQLAYYLIHDMAIQSEDLIAIQLERSQWMIVAILGVLKSGVAFVPVDPTYPQERIDYILKDCGAKVILSEKSQQIKVENKEEIKIIVLDDMEALFAKKASNLNLIRIKPEQLAYVIYTSGSTGKPKGCKINHSNLFNYIQWSNDYYFNKTESGNWGLITSFSFDLTFTSIFTSLTRGKKLWIGDAKKDINDLLQESFSHPEIDTLKLTPTHLTLIKASGVDQSNIDQIICGGEQLTLSQLSAIWDIKESIKIYNEYGPTEATVGCIVKEITREDKKITIGKPIANTEIYILNEYKQLCPIGAVGEIYIAGAGLSSGYLNQPELTKQKFVDNPFNAKGKMYKTGDLGKWSTDGVMEYIGRSDDQVKINGHRIELGEIEYQLETKANINQAVVLVNETADETKELVAYIISDVKEEVSSLRNYLSERIPEYMIPAYFIQLDKLPLTPNGKLDKRNLPDFEGAGVSDAIEYVAPRTKEEKILVKIWEGVLKRESIGVKSNFYHLGGDSIKSILVVSRLKKEGYTLKLSDLLESPVLEDLVSFMTELNKISDQSDVSGEVVLTPVQNYFFKYDGILEHHHYNQSVVLKSSELIDTTHIEQCLSTLVKHHDVLRMTYKKEGQDWKQHNAAMSSKSYDFKSYDLTNDKNPFERMNLLGNELQSQFNLSEGPLFKVAHFKTASGDYLALIIHHLVVDGVSWRILLEDLFTVYNQVKAGITLKLPLKSDSFQKWATLQKECALKEKITSELPYWEEICTTEIPALKTDYSLAEKKQLDKREYFTLDREVTDLLKTKINDKYNTEINDVLLTGLAMSIKKAFGIEKSMIKMEGHGREDIIDDIDISRTVGWFTSIYPMVLDIANTNGNAEALIQVKENLRKIPNKGIGFGMLKYLNEAGSNLSFSPTILFNYLGEFGLETNQKEESIFQYTSEAIGENISAKNTEEVLLDVSGSITSEILTISVGYSDAVYSEETIAAFSQVFKTCLTELVQELAKEESTHKTPSDLSYKKLAVNDLKVLNSDNTVEDIYELSPLQQGIYFHWLTSQSSSLYFEQISYRVHLKNADIKAISQAYQLLVDRHAILRTSFTNDLADVPLQIVRKKVNANFVYRKRPDFIQEENISDYVTEFKQADIKEGFDLSNHSLMRLKILDLGNEYFEFVWSHHHILMDGWCMSILIQDFNLILQALNKNEEVNFSKPIPYSNYINWLNKINVNTSLAYWKQQLENYNNVVSVPFIKNNTTVKEYRETVNIVKIEGGIMSKLQAMCNEIGITQNTFIQAVWGFVLSKYNNTDDVIFGGVVSGRPAELAGVEDIVGLFINTIPVRVKYKGTQTPLDLFKDLKEDAIAGNKHHYVNLAKVQSQSDLGADLINHIMVFENYLVKDALESEEINPNEVNNAQEFAIEAVDVFEQTNYDFNILVSPSEKSLQICFKFNNTIYDEALVEKLAAHFYTVAEQFILYKEKALEEIDFLSEVELALLKDFNATEISYESDKTILDLFSSSVQNHSAEVAVSYQDATLSYKDLDIRTGQLANYLVDRFGVKHNDLVGIKLERSSNMLVAILGILKSGGAYVPVDTNYPEERLEYIKSDSGYKVCIDEAFIKAFEIEKDNYSREVIGAKVLGNNLAYAIYTSGSTGNPKGVLNDHNGLYNRLLWMRDDLKINSADVILQKTPYTFDVSVWELLMPFVTGCKLVFAQPDGHKDPAYLLDLIQDSQVSILHFVPSMLGIFLEELNPEKCTSLKHVVCSGEALPAVMVEEFKQKLPWVRLHNLYGPTEAAIDVTSIDLTDVNTEESGVTIGKPVANTKIYIVDKNLSLQPVGVPGELLIEGVQVARGYLNRPELTEEKFIASPFNEGERIYRTGDLAKWLPNGEIAYLGRIDNQVKIRGNRIELGEIETRISESGYVENVAVLVKEDQSTRKYLVAYLIPRERYNQDDLFGYLKNRLPEYMIPGLLIEMDSFPLTSSGKLNRKLLPEPNDVNLFSESYEAPRDETETELAAIWGEVLGLDKVGIQDNFFRIGGDSIMSIRLISKINKKFNVSITIAQLYEFNTIAELGDQIKNNINSSEIKRKIKDEIEDKINVLKERVLEGIPNPENIEDIYPMSDIQKGMVILSTLNPEAGVYHDQFVFQIPTVDLILFKKTFSKLIEKHQSLRTRFDLTSYDEEIQIVEKEVDFSIDYQNIQNLDADKQDALINEIMISERQNPFNMESGLLWRISLFEINSTSTIFLFQFHHAILDGWSVASLNTELFRMYRELETTSEIKLEKLKSNYRDSVIEELYEKNNADMINFWKEELEDYKRLDIFKNQAENINLTKVYNFDFKHKLQEKCRIDGISVKTVLYAAFVYALKIINFEEDFVIGMVTNNRPVVEDGDKILGCFLNTIPVRNRLQEHNDLTWSTYFKNTEKQLNSLKSKERLTLYEISKITNEKTIEGAPFFDVLYNYVDFHIYNELQLEKDETYSQAQQQDLNIESFETTNTAFDLNVNLSGNGLTLGYKLKRSLKSDVSVVQIHDYITQILAIYLDAPDTKLSNTTFVSETELALLKGFNATDIRYESDKTILDLFASSVQNYSAEVAVSYQDATLSYKDLDIRTGQLANYLVDRYGVKHNDLVGIKLERSSNMLVAILGILKSGGAYVPVDTNYPEERLEYIKSDSGYKVCIDEAFIKAFEIEKDNYSREVIGAKVLGSNLAYAIYTSGSTGNPKGVLNDHNGLYNRLLWMRDDLKISSADVILQKTPYTFDVSVWELLMPSVTGCKLVFAQPDGHKDPAYLLDLIQDSQVSILHFVPSMLGIFLEELDPEKCTSLKHVVCSGEALPAVMVEEFKQKLPWVRLHNLYGPTEAAIDVTSIDLTDVNTEESGVTIGKPVANTKIYIVDKNLSLQPVGVPGELLIEGVQVARGYLNRPELTAEKFIASPFNEGQRIYRTGDLAKWLPNGEIAYLGRIDNQVKIRGNRIELGEIETRILESGYVENVAVLVKEDESGRKYLVAYLIPRERYNQDDLFGYLKNRLPEYMIPGLLIKMESFPLTSSGKLNRKLLPEPSETNLLSESYEAPRDETETELTLIWGEVLRLDKVGIRDNFFRIGGDSIMSIRLISKINKKFNVTITIAQLYEFNTIAELADQIKNNTISFEETKKVRDDIRVTFNSYMDEVLGNK
ncbi:non-ribosomal peptide synthase protein (TIGR01720 family)/amino acid adenylation domain-containing protein [Flavobacterium sp. 90]|uniref:non-ribosomal peptide synthetase n=2 Tax=unclassified Flavobacterium TaxID=196869 RepID=UPI0010E4C1B8|nr:non-ribosomal peptide synthetase [Flavobacterium sp. 90]TCK55875.1 non-ribosomal peptide synthase protein (TIGR01720 family)/amino acid adenylation domain-containing protein [Flavobacterium sp. 90]